MTKNIETLHTWIQQSRFTVFFGGAGVSTESGIPDFRSEKGIYQTVSEFGVPPETILSHTYFYEHPDQFFQYYRTMMLYPSALPNATHQALAYLEQSGKLQAIITQNIDGLHQKAGSKKVYELHGSVERNYCDQCHRYYELKDWIDQLGVPHCSCGGIIKPDVVLYEESLDEDTITGAVKMISQAELLIVGGTSLRVYPAAGLLRYFRGKHLVIINQDATPYDSSADLVIHEPLGTVFQTLLPK